MTISIIISKPNNNRNSIRDPTFSSTTVTVKYLNLLLSDDTLHIGTKEQECTHENACTWQMDEDDGDVAALSSMPEHLHHDDHRHGVDPLGGIVEEGHDRIIHDVASLPAQHAMVTLITDDYARGLLMTQLVDECLHPRILPHRREQAWEIETPSCRRATPPST